MNRYMESKWSWIEGTHGMRTRLLALLSDDELGFSPGGQNMTLGELIRECGEIEYAYIQSLQTFTQSWDYRNEQPGLANSVDALQSWLDELDGEMKETVSAMTDVDLDKMIERAEGFSMPVELQLEVYLQALLIFFGKAMVYLRAMEKPIPDDFQTMFG